jgi:hypothetical protein
MSRFVGSLCCISVSYAVLVCVATKCGARVTMCVQHMYDKNHLTS